MKSGPLRFSPCSMGYWESSSAAEILGGECDKESVDLCWGMPKLWEMWENNHHYLTKGLLLTFMECTVRTQDFCFLCVGFKIHGRITLYYIYINFRSVAFIGQMCPTLMNAVGTKVVQAPWNGNTIVDRVVATQIFFNFTPKIGEMIQFDEHIFQRGWSHQLVENLCHTWNSLNSVVRYLFYVILAVGVCACWSLLIFVVFLHSKCSIGASLWIWKVDKGCELWILSFEDVFQCTFCTL